MAQASDKVEARDGRMAASSQVGSVACVGRAAGWRRRQPGAAVAAVVLAAAAALGWSGEQARAAEPIFTIGNYPVEARAANAVAAKERAIADGQRAAFRALLKRLVPVTAYRRLAKLKAADPGRLIDSFAVRSERNSSTEYIASYDFVFSPDPVRRMLEAEGIPYLDRQAPAITIVPAYRVPPELAGKLPPTFAPAAGADAWLYAWKALDLGNSLTPAVLQPLKRQIHPDTIKALAEGDRSHLRAVSSEYQTETVVVAVLEPEADMKRLKVVLVGRDAVQDLYLKRNYRLDGQDFAYTGELAAVLSLAILEGRWKAINVRDSGRAPATAGGSAWAPVVPAAGTPGAVAPPPPVPGFGAAVPAGQPFGITIAFYGMGEWQQISRTLGQTPEVARLEVLGLSARRARVSLIYPGGPQRLALALAQQGLILQQVQGGWLLQRR